MGLPPLIYTSTMRYRKLFRPNRSGRAVLSVCRLSLNVHECETRDPVSVSEEDIAEHTYN